MKRYGIFPITLFSAGILVGCNGGSSSSGNSTDNGDASTLQIITSKTIYSKPGTAGSGYIVINNPTNTAVKNLHYGLTNAVGGAAGAEIESASAAKCAIVESNSQCNIKVTVPTGAVAGSVGFTVSNNSTSLLGRLSRLAKVATLTPVMGVEQSAYNSLSGADGVTLSYYHTVINGTPYVLVSGLVASANAGTFNKIVLVNGSGTELANQELIGEINSTQGSTFNILLPVPSGTNASQTIKLQTQQVANGQTTVVSTATASSTLTTTANVGIAEMLPSAVYLSESNPEQTVTFLNTGDAAAQLQQLVSNNPNVEVVFSPSSLITGATSTATLKLKDSIIAVTTGDITLTYNNGQSETTASAVVEQNVSPTPSPSPAPAPPNPGPDPGPVILNPVITITNVVGGTSEDMMGTPITFTATISNGGSSVVTATLANPVTGTVVSDPGVCALAVGGTVSCNFTVIPWYTGFDNSLVVDGSDEANIEESAINLFATNSATITGAGVSNNIISYGVTTPYVYLAAAVPGSGSAAGTGITWEEGNRFSAGKQLNGQVCLPDQSVQVDSLTGLMWVRTPTNTSYNWENAQIAPAIPASYCGYTDWRLPTITELLSLFNYAAINGNQADWLNNQGFTGVQALGYWSSTPAANGAWATDMNSGSSVSGDVSYPFYVWPVRGGQ